MLEIYLASTSLERSTGYCFDNEGFCSIHVGPYTSLWHHCWLVASWGQPLCGFIPYSSEWTIHVACSLGQHQTCIQQQIQLQCWPEPCEYRYTYFLKGKIHPVPTNRLIVYFCVFVRCFILYTATHWCYSSVHYSLHFINICLFGDTFYGAWLASMPEYGISSDVWM